MSSGRVTFNTFIKRQLPRKSLKRSKVARDAHSLSQVAGPVRMPAEVVMNVCILTGFTIPNGFYSIEHYYPRSRLPKGEAGIYCNKYPAIKTFNSIKGNHLPCEWEEKKYDLCYYAYTHYNLRNTEREMVRQALNGMWRINPCDYCMAALHKQYCIKER